MNCGGTRPNRPQRRCTMPSRLRRQPLEQHLAETWQSRTPVLLDEDCFEIEQPDTRTEAVKIKVTA